jgi:hypothetical protein
VGSCQLCQGYSNVLYHFGSLAFGSFLICFLRPVRWVLIFIVYAESLVDYVTYGYTRAMCGCFYECFETGLAHLSKNAFIAMAIQGNAFCLSGRLAADFFSVTGPLKPGKNGSPGKGAAGYDGTVFARLSGQAWFFTVSGLGCMTALGTTAAGLVVVHYKEFSEPSSENYIQDPMVFCWMAGFICFAVSLCFMLMFDTITDTIFLCAAMDYHDICANPIPKVPHVAPPDEGKTMFQSMFGCGRTEREDLEPAERKTFWPKTLAEILRSECAIPIADQYFGTE